MSGLVYHEALGIETCDLVTTSYGAGPYEVRHITPPRYYSGRCHGGFAIRTYPTSSLVLVRAGHEGPFLEHHEFYINDVRREGERWFTDSGDEVFVQKPESRPAMEMPDLFALASDDPRTRPYPWQEGVDYAAGDDMVWHCRHCHRDFNTPAPWGRRDSPEGWKHPDCSHCGYLAGGEPVFVFGLEPA